MSDQTAKSNSFQAPQCELKWENGQPVVECKTLEDGKRMVDILNKKGQVDVKVKAVLADQK